MTDAFVGLGSNLGDRLGNLSAALRYLGSANDVAVAAVSHVYESEPWGVADQPPFANAVAALRTRLSAEALLDLLQETEDALGRERAERYGPRVVDLDLLLFGDEVRESERLVVPHPRLEERAFVVTPLLEIAPDVRLPNGCRPDPERAVQGRILGVLGVVPGYERLTARP